ncbi:protein lin-37 homolog isoform X2 [Aethina tumida]|uniref:protein lin-37 homolog isoform X2 n=1 Tax=Aethina tumida TaxID=116153 RepID=UPI0021479BC8|nr:protein lin-37 homolog isoform X2 [Aethina tumida]
MTKKRKFSASSPLKMEKVEVKEENFGANEYQLAKGRLKGVLRQLKERSESDDSDSSDDGRRDKKRKTEMPAPYHHTYVMKLFDRSVDLARFEEDTPLYPICRAWMQNQPRNPMPIIKRRISSPDPEMHWNDTTELHKLPPPSRPFETRIPSPLPEQAQDKNNINLNYDECPPVDKNTLIRKNLERWVNVKKKWIKTAAKNEERYKYNLCILQAIHNKATESE